MGTENTCTDTTHKKSAITGGCLTCHAARMREFRKSKGTRGRRRATAVYQGNSCRRCGGTERYLSTRGCTNCDRQRGKVVVVKAAGGNAEFLRWITSPVITEAA